MPAVILKYPIWEERQREKRKRLIPSGPHLNTHHFARVSPIFHSFFIHRYKNSHYSSTLKGFVFFEWVKNSMNQNWCWKNVAGKQYCAPCYCKINIIKYLSSQKWNISHLGTSGSYFCKAPHKPNREAIIVLSGAKNELAQLQVIQYSSISWSSLAKFSRIHF